MKYDWKRYWCPREGKFNLSPQGFLQDPGENHIFNQDLVTFEEIFAVPCVILLGEPGIGKSNTMQTERATIDLKIHEKGDKTLWIDLRSYGNEVRLLKDLFNNEIFLSWSKGNYKLYLFIDSFDECLLRINHLAALLIDKIKEHPYKRLYLRIASRTADWPAILEKELYEIWGKDNVGIYELLPLTQKDVIEAAKANNLNAHEFLKEIEYKNVAPLAIKPLTLMFLLNLYKNNHRLPLNARDLYLRGCLLLCDESNDNRISSRLKGDFTAEQRIIIAGRIATITLFANKYAIWTSMDCGDMPEEDIHLRTLIGGNEHAADIDFIVDSFNINVDAVNETLKTGLFSSRGANRMGWGHKTYIEFLAAWYLVQHKIPPEKILDLIKHPMDTSGKLIPQLHGVSIWLANLAPDLIPAIMEKDPQILLRCDVIDTDYLFKESIIKFIFTQYNEKKLPYPSWQEQSLYRKLNHPRLAEQLKDYIFSDKYNTESKIFALRVGRACGLEISQEGIAEIALDASEDIRLRKEAANNILEIGPNEIKQKLKPLATGDAGEDPDDELKGLGLEALWPDFIGTNELFSIITPPKEHFIGNYKIFLHNVVNHIQPLDLPVALKWIESQQIKDDLSSFSHLADQIMLEAWSHIDQPGIVDGLARAMISRIKDDDGNITRFIRDIKFRKELTKDNDKRKLLLSALVPIFNDISKLYILIYYNPEVVTNNDFDWVLEQIQDSKYIDHQQRWARIANNILDIHKADQIESILKLYQANPGIRVEFARSVSPIILDSNEAKKMRERYFKMKSFQQENEGKKELLDPPPSTRVLDLLSRFESGEYDAWWQLTLDLTLEPDSKRYGNELEPNLASLPGWKEANVLTRDRIIQAAFDYITLQEPEVASWLGTNNIHRPATAGYKAFWLLFIERPDIFSSISHDTWIKWAPSIIAYPSHLRDISFKDIRKDLILKAYEHAPKQIIEALIILIDKENAELGHISIIRDFEDVWDDNLQKALLVKVKDITLKSRCIGDLLEILLAHDSHEARKYAESLFISSYSEEATREQSIIIGGLFLLYPSDSSWTILWSIIEGNIEIGKEIIAYAAGKSYRRGHAIEKSNKEANLAKLFIWMYHNCPPSEYSIPLGGFTSTPEYEIAEIRDSILRHLKERGTLASLEALAQIAKEFPQEDWFNWMIPEAQQIYLKQSWTPFKPIYIRKFIIDRNAEAIDKIKKNEFEKIILILNNIEFSILKLKLSSGSSRQDLSKLQMDIDDLRSQIKLQSLNIAELNATLQEKDRGMVERLEKMKEALLKAAEETARNIPSSEEMRGILEEIQRLKQSRVRDILGVTGDISSIFGILIGLIGLACT